MVCPKSHGACWPVQDSVLGQRLESVEDIFRIGNLVRENSLDMLQADHALSGVDVAMWDLLARARGVPVYELLGYPRATPKTPYASVLFGDSAQETLEKARAHTRPGLSRGQVRLGALWQGQRPGGRGPGDGRARGVGRGGHPARRRGHGVGGRRGTRPPGPARAASVPGHVAGRALCLRRARRLPPDRGGSGRRQAGRRRGSAHLLHGPGA